MAAQMRTGIHLQVLRELAEESPAVFNSLREATGASVIYLRDSLARLRRDGLVAVAYVLTNEGRNAVDCANERGIADTKRPPRHFKRKPRKVVAHQYPLATTDGQINELRRKAEADRSFGFESINQRGLPARK